MNLFYAEPNTIQENRIELGGQEAKHAVKVLRLRAGEHISVTDGRGVIYHCIIRMVKADGLAAEITSKEFEPRPEPYIAVAVGNIKKRDRLEFAAEKITELGADEILIYNGEHSGKNSIRQDRIQKTVESAMKQSLRLYLPEIGIFSSLQSLVREKKNEGFCPIVADEELEISEKMEKPPDKYLLIIGPEGGFSSKERAFFDEINAGKYSLGNKRLRTETAAIIMADHFKNRLKK